MKVNIRSMKNNMKSVFAITTLCLCIPTLAHTTGGVEIKDAWVREAPPNAKVLAAYMKIENHTGDKKSLTGITSPAFEKVEMHKTVHDQGMAKMIMQDSIEIAAEGVAVLKPGGMHLMLINPKSHVKAGDNISMTFMFSDGTKSIMSIPVKKGTGGGHHHHGDHDSNMKDMRHDGMKNMKHDGHGDHHKSHNMQQTQKMQHSEQHHMH